MKNVKYIFEEIKELNLRLALREPFKAGAMYSDVMAAQKEDNAIEEEISRLLAELNKWRKSYKE